MPIRLSFSVKWIVAACFLSFVVQHTGDDFFGTHFSQTFSLIPKFVFEQGEWWRLVTFSFLHGDVTQLFFDLLSIAFIGSDIEGVLGRAKFIQFYVFCVLVSALTYLLVAYLGWVPRQIPLLGPSGAIYGLLAAYALMFGERVLLFMMLFPMKAKHFVWILGLVSVMTSLYSLGHFGPTLSVLSGMFAGILFLRAPRGISISLGNRLKRARKGGHLKLVINNRNEQPSSSEKKPPTWH